MLKVTQQPGCLLFDSLLCLRDGWGVFAYHKAQWTEESTLGKLFHPAPIGSVSQLPLEDTGRLSNPGQIKGALDLVGQSL